MPQDVHVCERARGLLLVRLTVDAVRGVCARGLGGGGGLLSEPSPLFRLPNVKFGRLRVGLRRRCASRSKNWTCGARPETAVSTAIASAPAHPIYSTTPLTVFVCVCAIAQLHTHSQCADLRLPHLAHGRSRPTRAAATRHGRSRPSHRSHRGRRRTRTRILRKWRASAAHLRRRHRHRRHRLHRGRKRRRQSGHQQPR